MAKEAEAEAGLRGVLWLIGPECLVLVLIWLILMSSP